MPPYKDGDWYTEEEWAKKKAERKALNKAAFVAAKKVGKDLPREPVGTPLGNKQRMQEFKDKLLNAHTGESIIRKVIETALNDEHPGQMAAMKLCLDRMLPTSLFDEKKGGERTAIQINISGLGDPKVEEEGNTYDG